MNGSVSLVDALRDAARPLSEEDPHDALLEAIGDARVVLLGGSTHGTHEFYAERARLTRRLVAEKGFGAVAVEADWTDAFRVNRWVRGLGDDPDASAALSGFRHFPAWVWRNADVLAFVRWLRAHAAPPAAERGVGFYGLDLHGVHRSVRAVIELLEAADPAAARAARARYACFDAHGGSAWRYGARSAGDALPPCEDAVAEQLADMLRRARRPLAADDAATAEAWFDGVQNARVVMGAEAYYRALHRDAVAAWNLRERHMADAVDAILAHLGRRAARPRLVVWEHASHLGDARATELRERGALSAGQLLRARHGEDAFLVGFTTWSGTVTAASRWGGPAERKPVPPAPGGSYEALFHALGLPRFELDLRALGAAAAALAEPRLEHAIGVVHAPAAARRAPFVTATLPSQFDAAVHVDVTTAVEPLEPDAPTDGREPPETYPSGV